MGKKKLEATLYLQRIATLPYNTFFVDELKQIRDKYSIPALPSEAEALFKRLPSKKKYSLKDDFYDLLNRFQLPYDLIHGVVTYLITNETEALYWDFEHLVSMHKPPTKEHPFFTLRIAIATPWITRKEWSQIYIDAVRPLLHRKATEHGFNMENLPKQGIISKSLRKRMKRWAEWYQLSETQGLGLVQALKSWEKEHPDEYGKFDLSTVTHAIQEFQDIITPLQT